MNGTNQSRRRPLLGFDLIDDFAAAIPVEVIGNLLDIPRNERGPLRQWSLAILGALVLGCLGGYYFGWTGLGIGLLAGAVIGAILFWWMFMSA